jgi:hypothetical protein
MRRLRELAFCDIALAEHGSEVEAVCLNVELAFDGTEVTLDLSQANYDLIAKALALALEAGHPTEQIAPAMDLTSTRLYNERMRAWGDANGLGLGAGYTHGRGGHYHRRTLQRAYADHIKAAGQSG